MKRPGPGLLVVPILMCVTAGCRYGQSVENFPPAHTPAGAIVLVATDDGGLNGELVAVRDSGLVMLREGQLQSVPHASIQSIRIQVTGQAFESSGQPLEPQQREDIRLMSRYPQGISPELLDRLLVAYGQSALVGENQ